MPVDLSGKKKASDVDPKTTKTDWRPKIGTKVLILKHRFTPNRTGTVHAHEEWMGLKTISVKLDGTNQRVGVINPAQIKVLDDQSATPD